LQFQGFKTLFRLRYNGYFMPQKVIDWNCGVLGSCAKGKPKPT